MPFIAGFVDELIKLSQVPEPPKPPKPPPAGKFRGYRTTYSTPARSSPTIKLQPKASTATATPKPRKTGGKGFQPSSSVRNILSSPSTRQLSASAARVYARQRPVAAQRFGMQPAKPLTQQQRQSLSRVRKLQGGAERRLNEQQLAARKVRMKQLGGSPVRPGWWGSRGNTRQLSGL